MRSGAGVTPFLSRRGALPPRRFAVSRIYRHETVSNSLGHRCRARGRAAARRGRRVGRNHRLRRPGAAARARAAGRPRAGAGGARTAVAARTDRHAGGLGRGRHLLPQPHRADGGGESRRAAAISTTASTTRRVPSCSSRPRRSVSSVRGSRYASAATRGGTCPSPSWRWRSTRAAAIIGYTIGNDMSSRDIEGENPLYLPQAKVYTESCALGPCVLLTSDALSPDTRHRAPDPACRHRRVRRLDDTRLA